MHESACMRTVCVVGHFFRVFIYISRCFCYLVFIFISFYLFISAHFSLCAILLLLLLLSSSFARTQRQIYLFFRRRALSASRSLNEKIHLPAFRLCADDCSVCSVVCGLWFRRRCCCSSSSSRALMCIHVSNDSMAIKWNRGRSSR